MTSRRKSCNSWKAGAAQPELLRLFPLAPVHCHNFEMTTHDGRVVTSGEISDEVLAQLRAGKLAVRQKPGPINALGLVKLIFPNEYSVCLHSTPSPDFFSRSRRDFSRGCIRVEKPAELTAWASPLLV
jgi:murein L,D-transpeptidase YcbB/YkuD